MAGHAGRAGSLIFCCELLPVPRIRLLSRDTNLFLSLKFAIFKLFYSWHILQLSRWCVWLIVIASYSSFWFIYFIMYINDILPAPKTHLVVSFFWFWQVTNALLSEPFTLCYSIREWHAFTFELCLSVTNHTFLFCFSASSIFGGISVCRFWHRPLLELSTKKT